MGDSHCFQQFSGFWGVSNLVLIQNWLFRDRGYNSIVAYRLEELGDKHCAFNESIGAQMVHFWETLAVLGSDKG